MTQPIDAADLAEDSRWNAGVDYAITQLCVMLGVDPAKINWDAATETLDGDVMSVLGNALRAAYGDEWSSSSLNTACIRAALARPAVNAVGVAGLDPSPFITATSKGDGKTYYVTVKVRSIEALHAAHDLVRNAYKAAVGPVEPAAARRRCSTCGGDGFLEPPSGYSGQMYECPECSSPPAEPSPETHYWIEGAGPVAKSDFDAARAVEGEPEPDTECFYSPHDAEFPAAPRAVTPNAEA